MRKFSILRYLKQFSLLIFLVSVLGSLAIYSYGKSRQRYVASTVIQYTNEGAKDGWTPDGSPLNVEEIYSSTVIDDALTDLGVKPAASDDLEGGVALLAANPLGAVEAVCLGSLVHRAPP